VVDKFFLLISGLFAALAAVAKLGVLFPLPLGLLVDSAGAGLAFGADFDEANWKGLILELTFLGEEAEAWMFWG